MSSKSGGLASKPGGRKTAPPHPVGNRQPSKAGPAWHLLGVKRVGFLAIAKALAGTLTEVYGKEMSISKFEKALSELKGHEELRDKVHIDDGILEMHAKYVLAKKEMVDEQNLFRSTSTTAPLSVGSPLTVDALFKATPPSDRWADQVETGNVEEQSQGKD